MALDAYLHIEGIKGESTDERHRDWIEVSNVTWSVYQPRASVVSTAGGQTVGRAELSNISFSKLADLSSPLLQQTCAMGKTIPKARFEFMRADGNGQPIKYYEVEVENVMISGVTPASGNGGILIEQVQLAYSKMKWKYTKQSIQGGMAGNTSGGWDCAGLKCV
ncbi:Hcp family type VI secretion system effector [Massilia endophytica]|uniref:Hcp family type VI secretion system effector n=1 Tax=Massilia endophytica TaxID=2899220 RepID=UPI001E37D0F4|nr:type VI secretion system tube protein Hcp [Massilia endophytica]UGQ48713.1 type VI secretion system tube protein Hcp [Massilia endophytica]